MRVNLEHDYKTSLFVCKAMGAHLVEYENQQEIDAVISALNLGGKSRHWIGLDDITQEGTFVWEHSGQNLSYSEAWKVGEPNDRNNEDCVVQHRGNWSDAECDQVYNYICEME